MSARPIRCVACGREEPSDGDWDRVEHPPLGTMTQCPDCGSTDVHALRGGAE